MPLTADDIRDFNAYLKNCTDAQVRGVWEKETKACREDYAALAEAEAAHRGVSLDDPMDDFNYVGSRHHY